MTLTKVRKWAVLIAVVAIGVLMLGPGVPRGWYGGDDGDGARTITLIGYASNDSLQVTARVQTSRQGVILSLPFETIDDDSWDYSFEVRATEHVSVQFSTWVTSVQLGDRSTTLCRIEDNGDKVAEARGVVSEHRRDTIAMCSYVA